MILPEGIFFVHCVIRLENFEFKAFSLTMFGKGTLVLYVNFFLVKCKATLKNEQPRRQKKEGHQQNLALLYSLAGDSDKWNGIRSLYQLSCVLRPSSYCHPCHRTKLDNFKQLVDKKYIYKNPRHRYRYIFFLCWPYAKINYSVQLVWQLNTYSNQCHCTGWRHLNV